MTGTCQLNPNQKSGTKIAARNDFLFTVAAVAALAGFLLTLPVRLFDVLLIFSISLTAAVLIITISARRAIQVQGFPALVVFATGLRIMLSIAAAKLIYLYAGAGAVTGAVGRTFTGQNYLLSILLFSLTAMVAFGLICKTAKGLCRTASDFILNIAPINQTCIDSDLDAGLFSKEQSLQLKENISRETAFFVAMTAVAKFILFAAVIELVVVIVTVAFSTTAGIANHVGLSTSAQIYAAQALGAGIATQIPALLVVLACRYLVGKSSLNAVEQKPHTRIKVVARDVTAAKQQQKQNEKPAPLTDTFDALNTKISGSSQHNKTIVEDLQWCDEKSKPADKKDDAVLWQWKEIKDGKSYGTITELIESQIHARDTRPATILMAAENIESLGVTVPVNIAMRLAQKNKKCLLIDLDLHRAAISKVFNIADQASGKTQPTCISNLSVLQADSFTQDKAANLPGIIDNFKDQYDRLIIYAPDIKLLADKKQIADCVTITMLFGQTQHDNTAINKLHATLTASGSRIIKPQDT